MKKDRSKVVERLRNKIKPENRIFIQKNLAISEQLHSVLEQKGWTQKDLARKMGKHESEISKWMTGLHNLTVQSISLMEACLESEIIVTPLEAYKKYKEIRYITLRVSAYSNTDTNQKELSFEEDVILNFYDGNRKVA
jgi:transcriptional regulator with XRE-family HTH domain